MTHNQRYSGILTTQVSEIYVRSRTSIYNFKVTRCIILAPFHWSSPGEGWEKTRGLEEKNQGFVLTRSSDFLEAKNNLLMWLLLDIPQASLQWADKVDSAQKVSAYTMSKDKERIIRKSVFWWNFVSLFSHKFYFSYWLQSVSCISIANFLKIKIKIHWFLVFVFLFKANCLRFLAPVNFKVFVLRKIVMEFFSGLLVK